MSTYPAFSAFALSSCPLLYLAPDVFTLAELKVNNPSAFAAMTRKSLNLLDSGCTNHIVPGQRFFHTYNPGRAISVKTANTGSLVTQALGTCYFKMPIKGTGRSLILEMHDCLHAPNAPVNLISTGEMLAHHFALYMAAKKMKIYILGTPCKFAIADVKFRLCILCGLFLLCNEILGSSDLKSIAMVSFALPVFERPTPNGELWHNHLLHLGRDVLNTLLQGTFVTGLDDWNRTKMHGTCVACLKGKQTSLLPLPLPW